MTTFSRRLRLLGGAAIAVGAVSLFSLSPRASASSSGSVDLRDWELILPVNYAGHLSGTAAVRRPARLSPPWLTRQANGGIRFYAPSDGATTGHSLHTRTELVSLHGFAAGRPGHRLTATLAVEELPTVTHTVVVGQVHGYGPDSAAPFALLKLRGSTLEISVESKPKLKGSKGPSDGEVTSNYTLMSGVTLGRRFSYSLTTTRNALRIATSMAKGPLHLLSVPVPPAWQGHEVNFSAGDYGQDDAASSKSGGSRVVFYVLTER